MTTRNNTLVAPLNVATIALLALVALLALISLGMPALAQEPEPGRDAPFVERGWRGGDRGGRSHRGPGMDPLMMALGGPGGGPGLFGIHFALKQLDLSDGQRDEIKRIIESEREQVVSLHEEMRLLGAQVRDQIESDPHDEASVRAKAQAVAAVNVELAVVRARQAGRVREVLTPEQLEELARLKELRGALREHRRETFERHRQKRRPAR